METRLGDPESLAYRAFTKDSMRIMTHLQNPVSQVFDKREEVSIQHSMEKRILFNCPFSLLPNAGGVDFFSSKKITHSPNATKRNSGEISVGVVAEARGKTHW